MTNYFNDKQNIMLIYGDNASGKTRFLIEMMEYETKNGNSVVTNIPGYYKDYALDERKYNRAVECECDLYMMESYSNPKKYYSKKINSLANLICAVGDILVVDDIDSYCILEYIPCVTKAISCVRGLWKRIYVSAINSDFMCMMTDIDYDDNYLEQTYNENVWLKRKESQQLIKIDGSKLYEYTHEI